MYQDPVRLWKLNHIVFSPSPSQYAAIPIPAMSSYSHDSISETDITIITTTHLKDIPPTRLNRTHLISIPPAPMIPPPPPPVYRPTPTHSQHMDEPTFPEIPNNPHTFPPASRKESKSLTIVYPQLVVTMRHGEHQHLFIPDRRVRIGDSIWVEGMGLGHIIRHKAMCGKYVSVAVRLHRSLREEYENPVTEIQVWFITWHLILPWHVRFQSLKEWILRRKFILYDV